MYQKRKCLSLPAGAIREAFHEVRIPGLDLERQREDSRRLRGGPRDQHRLRHRSLGLCGKARGILGSEGTG